MKLEELERRLRTDIMQEAIAWAGRVMLHREVSLDTPAAREISFDQAATPSTHLYFPPLSLAPPCLPCSPSLIATTGRVQHVRVLSLHANIHARVP